MTLRILFGQESPEFFSKSAGTSTAGPRPVAALVSLCLHVGAIAYLLFGPPLTDSFWNNSHYQVIVKPIDQVVPSTRKLIWYAVKRQLPEVSAANAKARGREQGLLLGRQTIISEGPKAERFVWQKAPELRAQPDFKTPNLLSVEAPAPPPQRPPPKAFVPPAPMPASRPKPQTLLAANAPDLPDQTPVDTQATLPLARVSAPPKAFVVPAAQPTQPVRPQSVLSTNLPALPDQTPASSQASLPLASVSAPPKAFVVPASSYGAGAGSQQGATVSVLDSKSAPQVSSSGTALSGTATAAVIGLKPGSQIDAPLPSGAPSGSISVSPNPGGPGSPGAVPGAGVEVPGLMIKGRDPNAATSPISLQPLLSLAPVDKIDPGTLAPWQNLVRSALSVPLRPQARIIPRNIDNLFPNRNLYTTAFQMPSGAVVSSLDWVIWFAERQPDPGQTPAVRPPLPWRHLARSVTPPEGPLTGVVRLTAVIEKTGRVDSILVVSSTNAFASHTSVKLLTEWQFLPALRGGIPVSVDAYFELRFP
jgi:hypothetical protein